jgi:hypothetical protein
MTRYAQAVITQSVDGNWKITVQSDRQVERCLYGTFDQIIKELKDASSREWERRSDARSDGEL